MEGAASNDRVYLQESETLNTDNKPKNIRESHTLFKAPAKRS